MSAISSAPVSPEVVLLSVTNPNVANNAVVPCVSTFDSGKRWDAAQNRITAKTAELWRVKRPDHWPTVGGTNLEVFRSGVKTDTLMTNHVVSDGSAFANWEILEILGVVIALQAGDYIDFRQISGAAADMGTFQILCERLA